ncbi:hypothetical protein JYU22_04420 [Gammaproteobacteria bacterium AH-315-E17]|nr:hypothetical protein [Gammaproteobacteria bacterium AH-315-E17]
MCEANPATAYVANTTLVKSRPLLRNVEEISQGVGTGFVWGERSFEVELSKPL